MGQPLFLFMQIVIIYGKKRKGESGKRKPHQEVVMGKAKLNRKWTSLILILALVATIIPTSVYGNLLVSRSTNGVAIPRGCNVSSFY